MHRAFRSTCHRRPLNALTPLVPITRLAEASRPRQLVHLSSNTRHANGLPSWRTPAYSSAFCRPYQGQLTQQRGLASSSPPQDEKEKKKPTRWETIKATFREHGKVFVLYYTTTWLGGFGIAFGGVTLAGLDGLALLQYLGADSVIDTSQFSTRVINALIAAEINELAEFVRLPLVIATTPALSRRLRGGSAAAAESDKSDEDSSKQ
jgi:hypothetical protein